MLLKLARAALNRGWMGTYAFLFELDLLLSGLGGASRRIRRAQKARRALPFVGTPMIEGRRQ